ncbi:MAG: tetratricopeptide repeat protein [Bradymonadaceae bacterium]
MKYKICTAVIAVALLGACQKEAPPTTIIVPSTATTTAQYQGDGSIPPQRYVVRMSDGQRDWEVEFPETARGYEVRIPLKEDPSSPRRAGVRAETSNLTAADKELLEHLRRTNPDMEREGIFVGGRNVNDPPDRNRRGGLEPGAELDGEGRRVSDPGPADGTRGIEDRAAPTRPSYLLGIEEVQRLFRSGNHELAMVHLVDLEKAYPNDPRLLAMKGTLWMKLGRPELARETWERVLQIDPDNRAVLDALRSLNQGAGQDE